LERNDRPILGVIGDEGVQADVPKLRQMYCCTTLVFPQPVRLRPRNAIANLVKSAV